LEEESLSSVRMTKHGEPRENNATTRKATNNTTPSRAKEIKLHQQAKYENLYTKYIIYFFDVVPVTRHRRRIDDKLRYGAAQPPRRERNIIVFRECYRLFVIL
jgi:hypothetical protein